MIWGAALTRRPVARAALAALALLLGPAACDVDPNAPGRRGGGFAGGRRHADVSGDWVYSVTNLGAEGVSCSLSNVALSLEQRDSTFTGTYAGGQMVCAFPGEPARLWEIGAGAVLNGLVRGDSVYFDLDTPDWHSRGRLSGNSISGETRVRLDLGLDGVFILTGTFGAAKR